MSYKLQKNKKKSFTNENIYRKSNMRISHRISM